MKEKAALHIVSGTDQTVAEDTLYRLVDEHYRDEGPGSDSSDGIWRVAMILPNNLEPVLEAPEGEYYRFANFSMHSLTPNAPVVKWLLRMRPACLVLYNLEELNATTELFTVEELAQLANHGTDLFIWTNDDETIEQLSSKIDRVNIVTPQL